jgi:hypothetical protein
LVDLIRFCGGSIIHRFRGPASCKLSLTIEPNREALLSHVARIVGLGATAQPMQGTWIYFIRVIPVVIVLQNHLTM